jgi:hypothetical protein
VPIPNDLTGLDLPQLLAAQDEAAGDLAAAKALSLVVAQELARRYGDSAKQALTQAGKSHGTTTLPLQDGFAAKAEVKQTVKWDSDALMAVAQTLPWERVVALFSIKFSMSEMIYKGVSALSPELRAKIDAARTTVIGEPSVTLTRA